MKVAYLDAKKGKRVPKNSITVAFRNLIELKIAFGGDIYACEDDFRGATDDYDVIVCGFGSVSSEYNLSTEFLKKNERAKVLWLVGEYEQSTFPPLFYSGREYEVIANGEFRVGSKRCKAVHVVNFNSLSYRAYNGDYSEKTGDLIYYGRWREGRRKYIEKYLPLVDLSTSPKNYANFLACGRPQKLIKPLSWARGTETLRRYRRSLYIEDEFTHTCFNNLANRFYEALSCGCASVFDHSCEHTIIRSGCAYNDDWFNFTADPIAVHKGQEIAAMSDKKKAIGAIGDILAGEK